MTIINVLWCAVRITLELYQDDPWCIAPKVETQLRSWASCLLIPVTGDRKMVFGEQMNVITVMLRTKYSKYKSLQAIVEKLSDNVCVCFVYVSWSRIMLCQLTIMLEVQMLPWPWSVSSGKSSAVILLSFYAWRLSALTLVWICLIKYTVDVQNLIWSCLEWLWAW